VGENDNGIDGVNVMCRLTCAALSSKPFSNVSNTLSQPSNAFEKFHERTVSPTASFFVLIVWREATKEVRKGSKSLTKRVLSEARSSSTYVSCRIR
jgi:hypothetical protein